MRLLGLDVGEKRIGIARADSNTRIAIPVGTILADDGKWQELARLSRLYNTDIFILGLPRSNEGNETAQSLYVRNFATTLTEKLPEIRIRFQDESLTSVEAEKRLKKRKKSYGKAEIDAEAASIILQDFLENFHEETKTVKDTNLIEKNAEKVMLKSKKVVHKSKKLSRFIILPPIFLVILGLAFVTWWGFSSLGPVDKNCAKTGCAETTFPVAEGDTVDTVAKNLEKSGLIRSALIFKIYHKFRRPTDILKSGTYTLSKGLSVNEIITTLAAGSKDSRVFSFTILPGETLFDVKAKLIKIGYNPADIDAAMTKPYDFDLLADKPKEASLEGYLFGETHEFYQNASVEDIISTFLENFDRIVSKNDFKTKFKEQGLTLYEGITLASVVQKEALPADQPTVAQVFYSRLAQGEKLGSDVTTKYALDLVDPKRETYRDNESAAKITECHNTRLYTGLPCGPIASPSLSALEAVAEPSDTSYFYFLTGDDGKMYYSYTESEHNQNAIDHCHKLCNLQL